MSAGDYYDFFPKEEDEDSQQEGGMKIKRLDWMNLWDKLRSGLKTGNTTWGRNQILELMDRLEREMVREYERESDK